MKIFFARHGESLANTLRIISNRDLPHPLTEIGRTQALSVAQRLAGKGIVKAFASPVLRATQTGEIISGRLSVPLEIVDGLREYDCGILEGRGDAQAWQIHQAFFRNWRDGLNREQCPPGGETFYDIRDRFVPFIERLAAEYGESDAAVACIGHGGLFAFGLPHILTNVDAGFVFDNLPGHTTLIETESRPGVAGFVCLEWGEKSFGRD